MVTTTIPYARSEMFSTNLEEMYPGTSKFLSGQDIKLISDTIAPTILSGSSSSTARVRGQDSLTIGDQNSWIRGTMSLAALVFGINQESASIRRPMLTREQIMESSIVDKYSTIPEVQNIFICTAASHNYRLWVFTSNPVYNDTLMDLLLSQEITLMEENPNTIFDILRTYARRI